MTIINRVIIRSQRLGARSVSTIISPANVASSAGIRIVDVGSADAYSRAHVPNAIRLPFDPFLKDPRTGGPLGPDFFAQVCAAMGIGKDTHVVAYDGGAVMWAARLWWMLKYYGHEHVSVLDGCWPGYVRSGGAISVDVPPQPEAPVPQLTERPEYYASGQDVLELVESGHASSRPVQIVDTRSVAEFSGADLKGNARGGHVPGAINVPHGQMLTPQGAFKSPEELRQLFEKAGVDLSKPSIAYCQAGVRGALGVLALELAGSTARAANYDGSMKEWLNDPKCPVDK